MQMNRRKFITRALGLLGLATGGKVLADVGGKDDPMIFRVDAVSPSVWEGKKWDCAFMDESNKSYKDTKRYPVLVNYLTTDGWNATDSQQNRAYFNAYKKRLMEKWDMKSNAL